MKFIFAALHVRSKSYVLIFKYHSQVEYLEMKNIFIAVLLMFVLSSMQGQNKKIKSLENSFDKLIELLENPSEIGLKNLISPDVVYSHSSGKVDTRESLMSGLLSGESDFVKIDISNRVIKKVGKSSYVVTHNLSASTNNGGKLGEIKLFVLTVWENKKDNWQLIARQATKI